MEKRKEGRGEGGERGRFERGPFRSRERERERAVPFKRERGPFQRERAVPEREWKKPVVRG